MKKYTGSKISTNGNAYHTVISKAWRSEQNCRGRDHANLVFKVIGFRWSEIRSDHDDNL